MVSTKLRRVTRRISRVAAGMLGTFLVSASVSHAQSVIQITDINGNVVPAAVGVYASGYYCYNAGGPPMPAQICIWTLRKVYGDFSVVVVIADAPHGNPPGCVNGATQSISGGYTRSNCFVYATAAAYGH
jgi:hypothetical protein